jgi:hypothetical protein
VVVALAVAVAHGAEPGVAAFLPRGTVVVVRASTGHIDTITTDGAGLPGFTLNGRGAIFIVIVVIVDIVDIVDIVCIIYVTSIINIVYIIYIVCIVNIVNIVNLFRFIRTTGNQRSTGEQNEQSTHASPP